MKWTIILNFVSIGLVVGDGAWKRNQEYNYKLQAKSFLESSESKNKWSGVVSRARLSILPQSDELLFGQINQAEYADQELSEVLNTDINEKYLEYTQWPLNKPFKIHLRNGAITSLSVDITMTNHQINQLKVIASQLQVDTNVENVMEDEHNVLPQEDNKNAFYKTMEPTVTGNCETSYDISPLPDYLAQHYRDMMPLTNSDGAEEFMQIIKTKNNDNCNERSGYLHHTTNRNKDRYSDDLTQVSRIVVSGSLKKYTIQSSVTTNKIAGSPGLYDYVNITLESVVPDVQYQQFRFGNMMNTGNLVYFDDSLNIPRSENRQNARSQARQGVRPYPMNIKTLQNGDPADQWTGCWSWFPASDAMCLGDFGPEWESVQRTTCGFLGLGMKAKCTYKYPRCEATVCYSVVVPRSQLCNRNFSGRLPVTKGGWENCVPGFYRSRCCPA